MTVKLLLNLTAVRDQCVVLLFMFVWLATVWQQVHTFVILQLNAHLLYVLSVQRSWRYQCLLFGIQAILAETGQHSRKQAFSTKLQVEFPLWNMFCLFAMCKAPCACVTVLAILHDNTLEHSKKACSTSRLIYFTIWCCVQRQAWANTVHICQTEAVAQQSAGDDTSATDWSGLSCMQAIMCCFWCSVSPEASDLNCFVYNAQM